MKPKHKSPSTLRRDKERRRQLLARIAARKAAEREQRRDLARRQEEWANG